MSSKFYEVLGSNGKQNGVHLNLLITKQCRIQIEDRQLEVWQFYGQRMVCDVQNFSRICACCRELGNSNFDQMVFIL